MYFFQYTENRSGIKLLKYDFVSSAARKYICVLFTSKLAKNEVNNDFHGAFTGTNLFVVGTDL